MVASIAPPSSEVAKYVVVRDPQDETAQLSTLPLRPDDTEVAAAEAAAGPSTPGDLKAIDTQFIALLTGIGSGPIASGALDYEHIQGAVVALAVDPPKIQTVKDILRRYWVIYLTSVRFDVTELADGAFRRIELLANLLRVQDPKQPRLYRRHAPVVESNRIVTPGARSPTKALELVAIKGVGDLMVIRKHLRRYSLGAITHVESVMKGERRERHHVAGSSLEETLLIEEEVTTGTERDLETRTSTEVSQEIERESQSKRDTEASINATASYGAVLSSGSATINQRSAASSSMREAQRSARRTMQETVSRAIERVEKRKLTRTTRTSRIENKETNVHVFESEDSNNVGVYRELLEHAVCRSYNYGARLFLELNIPEPAAVLLDARDKNQSNVLRAARRRALKLKPNDITREKYAEIAASYGISVDPPPPETKCISRILDGTTFGPDRKELDFQGYRPIGGRVTVVGAQLMRLDLFFCGKHIFKTEDLGGKQFDSIMVKHFTIEDDELYMMGEDGTTIIVDEAGVPILIDGNRNYEAYIHNRGEGGVRIGFELYLRITDVIFAAWQSQVFAQVVEAVEEAAALTERRAAALAAGDFRRQLATESDDIIRGELRRSCVEVLKAAWGRERESAPPESGGTGQKPGTGEEPGTGSPSWAATGLKPYQPAEHADRLRDALFFEDLLEWPNLVFVLLPYHVAKPDDWLGRLGTAETDPLLARFLQAGSANVLVPVQRGRERAVLHYLRCGKTWGGPGTPLPPDRGILAGLGDVELGDNVDPGKETARPEGDRWGITLRTGVSVLYCPEVKLPRFPIPEDMPFMPSSKVCSTDNRPYNAHEWPDDLAAIQGLARLGYSIPTPAPATAAAATEFLRREGKPLVKSFQQHVKATGVADEAGLGEMAEDGLMGACTFRALSAAVKALEMGEWEAPR